MENKKQVKPEVGAIYVDDDAQFYEVVKATAKTVTLRPIASKRIEPNGQADYHNYFLPRPGEYTKARIKGVLTDEPFTRRLIKDPGRFNNAVKIDGWHFFAFLWDGKPVKEYHVLD